MNKRSENMKMVNDLRSKVTSSVIDLLDELEEGKGGDYGGFDEWKIKDYHQLKGQLNSYRAQKIAQFLGKNISKQKLLKYVKPEGYVYSLTNKELDDWLDKNSRGLHRYLSFNIQMMTKGKRS